MEIHSSDAVMLISEIYSSHAQRRGGIGSKEMRGRLQFNLPLGARPFPSLGTDWNSYSSIRLYESAATSRGSLRVRGSDVRNFAPPLSLPQNTEAERSGQSFLSDCLQLCKHWEQAQPGACL